MSTRRTMTYYCFMAAGLCLPANNLRADPAPPPWNIQKPPGWYGNLDQHDANINPPAIRPVACGPTAAVNSFKYLENAYPGTYAGKLLPGTLAAAATKLAGPAYMNTKVPNGTWSDMFIYGKQKYMNEAMAPVDPTEYAAQIDYQWAQPDSRPIDEIPPIPKPVWVQDSTNPTKEFLYDWLWRCADVEILVNWIYQGDWTGHYLTIASLHWTDTNSNNKMDYCEADIDYIDPWDGRWYGTAFPGSPVPAGPPIKIWQADGTLQTNYPGYAANITMIMAQIPEPATFLLVAIGGLALLRKEKK